MKSQRSSSSPPSAEKLTSAKPSPDVSPTKRSVEINHPAVGSNHVRLSLQSILNPIKQNSQRCVLFFFRCCTKTNKISSSLEEEANDPTLINVIPTTPSEIKERITAERVRVDEIKKLMESKQYSVALRELTMDTPEDLHYFNKIKGDVQGHRHYEVFDDHTKKHGKLLDFEERPASLEEPTFCLWSGINDFGHPLRCHNQCLKQHINQLGNVRSQPLHFCVYHVQYCIKGPTIHPIPMKVRTPNEQALCNECYIQQNCRPPTALLRIPGTRRKRD